ATSNSSREDRPPGNRIFFSEGSLIVLAAGRGVSSAALGVALLPTSIFGNSRTTLRLRLLAALEQLEQEGQDQRQETHSEHEDDAGGMHQTVQVGALPRFEHLSQLRPDRAVKDERRKDAEKGSQGVGPKRDRRRPRQQIDQDEGHHWRHAQAEEVPE